jgi:hypothetical protein
VPSPGVASVAPVGVAPDDVAPDGVAPDGVAPGRVAPGRVAPGHVAPDGVVPDGVAPAGVPRRNQRILAGSRRHAAAPAPASEPVRKRRRVTAGQPHGLRDEAYDSGEAFSKLIHIRRSINHIYASELGSERTVFSIPVPFVY